MTKKELMKLLDKIDDDNIPVYIHVSYNTYAIRQIVDWEDFLVFTAGEVVNPELEDYAQRA